MIPIYVVRFNPFRLIGVILLFGLMRGAAHGDWQAIVILGTVFVLGWWHDILEFWELLAEGWHQAGCWLHWAKCKVRGVSPFDWD